MQPSKILIVEDEGIVALDLKRRLSKLGYAVTGTAASSDQALELAAADPPALILMDIHIKGDLNGIETARLILDRQPVPIVFLTAHSDAATLEEAKSVTPYGYLVKPFEERSLQSTIEMAIYKYRMEQRLRQEEDNFRTLTEMASDGIVIIDAEGRHVYANPRATEITGYSDTDLVETKIKDLLENAYDFECVKTGEDIKRCEAAIQNKAGDIVYVELSGSLTVWRNEAAQMIMIRDISNIKAAEEERKRLQEQLAQSEKLKAMGTLAGGIAHDFNNLLMGIQGYASLMSEELKTSHPHQVHLKTIEETVQSAANLTDQLLGFARGGKYEVKTLNVIDLVRTSAEMFGRTRKEIRVHTKTQPGEVVVAADGRQLEQVLMSMYLNASQAMPTGGDLFLEVSRVQLDEAVCLTHRIEPGIYAKISVTDTGIGMDEDTLNRVFDPFFTTKELNRGTGMGLASAYGIISNHKGIITVYSEQEHGTTFNIYLPVSEQAVRAESAAAPDFQKGTETILLVDDEELIIGVGRDMLNFLGYRVLVAQSGAECVDLVTGQVEDIDLIILDMIMPGMDGAATFEQIRALAPDMPVILSSGYALNGQAAEIMEKGCNNFIQKPFNIKGLSEIVRKTLEETGAH